MQTCWKNGSPWRRMVFQAKTSLAVESQNSRMDGVFVAAVSEGYSDVIALNVAQPYFSPMEVQAGCCGHHWA